MMRGLRCAVFLGVVLCALPARAQVATADSLLAAGRIGEAEELYYATSDAQPRDPIARAALGRYLASRGALRVGAVLLEEARQFGADPAYIARELVPVYRELGDWRALSALPASPLTPTERAQAQWLVDHPPSVAMPESVSVPMRIVTNGAGYANIRARVDGADVDATIVLRAAGVVLDTSWRARADAVFGGARRRGTSGVVTSVAIGAAASSNAPVRFTPLGGARHVIIGVDVLAPFAPTFDAIGGRLVLHKDGVLPRAGGGRRRPTLTDAAGIRIFDDGRWIRLDSPELAEELRRMRWTLDSDRGALVREP